MQIRDNKTKYGGRVEYKRELENFAKMNEKEYSLILRQDFQSNLAELKHKMLLERETLKKVYDDVACLEMIDLEDFWQKEKNDRPN